MIVYLFVKSTYPGSYWKLLHHGWCKNTGSSIIKDLAGCCDAEMAEVDWGGRDIYTAGGGR